MTPSTINIISKLTKSDWVVLYFYYLLRHKHFWIRLILYFLGLVLLFSTFTKYYIVYSFIILIIWGCIDIISALTKFVNEDRTKGVIVYYEISEDFIRGVAGNLKTEILINDIIKVAETRYFFLIS